MLNKLESKAVNNVSIYRTSHNSHNSRLGKSNVIGIIKCSTRHDFYQPIITVKIKDSKPIRNKNSISIIV